MTPFLELQDVVFAYDDGNLVLKGANLHLLPGGKVGIQGRNGSGKTTLFRIITGLEKPSGGEILFRGKPLKGNRKNLSELRKNVGYLFQDPEDQLFCPTLLEDVAFGPLNLGLSPAAARKKAFETLRLFDLEHLADKPPHTLSGGQKRLGALSAVLAMEPRVLLLDEPTGDLDEKALESLERLLLSEETTFLVVSHDEEFLNKVTNRKYCLDDGRLLPL
jgi:cobalt/nickel transport system ATP-binding protein